jgi:glycosyltransferase involved in cell wall biosynthesis
MKVTIVTYTFNRKAGGLYPTLLSLVDSLNELAIKTNLLAVDTFDNSSFESKSELVSFRMQFLFLPFKILRSLVGIWVGLNQSRPNLVHTHGLWLIHSLIVPVWCKLNKVPWVVTPHGMLNAKALEISKIKKVIAFFLYERVHLNSAACLHALTTNEAIFFRDYGLKNPIAIIPNGVNKVSVEFKRLFPSPNLKNRKSLLYLGRLHPIKGMEALLDGWANLKNNNQLSSSWDLLIAGWGDDFYVKALEKKVNFLGISSSVILLGPKYDEEKRELLVSANAFILPSTSEGLPISILEAWTYCLPVLMTPECNLTECAFLGAGILIEPSKGGVESALDRLVSMSPIDLEIMGARGLQLVHERYLWKRIAMDMVKVYRWVCGDGSKPSCVRTS